MSSHILGCQRRSFSQKRLVDSIVSSCKEILSSFVSSRLPQRGTCSYQFLQSCLELHATPSHSQGDSEIFSLLTNYAACVDIPTAASQKYNLTLFTDTRYLLQNPITVAYFTFPFHGLQSGLLLNRLLPTHSSALRQHLNKVFKGLFRHLFRIFLF